MFFRSTTAPFLGNARDALPACPSDRLWLVRGGMADIFIESGSAEEGTLLRRLLGTAETGSLILTCENADFRVEIVPLDKALLEPVHRSMLEAAQWEAGLAAWWNAVAVGLGKLGFPFRQINLLAEDLGEERALAMESGKILSTLAPLVWAEAATPLLLLGEAQRDVAYPVPLVPRSWCTAAVDTEVVFHDTQAMLARGTLEAAANSANFLCFQLAYALVLEDFTSGQAKLEQRRQREEDVLNHLIAASVDSLDGKRRARKGEDVVTDLQRACRHVARWHGIAFQDTAKDNEKAPIGRRMRNLAQSSRFQTRIVALQDKWWQEDFPALLAFDHASGEPVAVIPGKARGGVLFDKSSPAGRPLTAQEARRLDGKAYLFHAGFTESTRSLADCWRFGSTGNGGLNNGLWPLVLLVLATSLLGTLPPMVLKVLFGSAITSADLPTIIDLAIALLLIQGTSILVTLSYDVALLRLDGRTMMRLQAALFDRVLRLSTRYLNGMPLGKLHSKWMLFEKLQGSGTLRLVITTTLTFILSVCSLFQMFSFFPLLGAVVLLLTLALVFIAAKTGPRQLAAQAQGAALDGHYWSIVTEALRGVRKLRMSGAEGRVFNRWMEFLVERRLRFLQAMRHRNRLQMVMSVFEGVILLMILVVISFEFTGHALPMGPFMAFLAASKTFTHAVAVFSGSLPDFYLLVKDDLPDVMPFLSREVENPAVKSAPGELVGNIEIAKLSFRYDGAPRMALNGISIEAQPGEFIAVTGPSGCGKSTLFKLLLGVEQPTSGAVFYDGRNLNQMDVIAVRGQIGTVMQSASLIPGTVFDYIASGRPLTLTQAWDVARKAGIDRMISALPMGMFTIISENGSALSGGEMQRLMIARAIAGNPKILLFDEATSWLDNNTQRQVIESLSRLRITRMVIAHRLSTLQQADRIYVLDNGEVAEIGTYVELMEGSGLFSTLIKHQLA